MFQYSNIQHAEPVHAARVAVRLDSHIVKAFNIRRAQQLSLNITPHINHLYRGDCLGALDQIDDESIDLAYIDPPFFSQRYYETIWGEAAEKYAFEDRWKGGIQTYINYLVERIRKIYEKLKPEGSLYVHLDWHICHYMKVELDKLFGYHNFRNEIAWCYTGPGSPGMRQFMRKHDNLFWYSKSRDKWTFNADAVRIPHSGKTKQNYKAGLVGSGFVAADHLIHAKGKVPEDWWPIAIAPRGKEYLGYPTQKPLALLNRIVQASSNKDDLVLDAFCGCGTTLEAAQNAGRRFIGIDISQAALNVVQKRLAKINAHIEKHGMIESEKQLHDLNWREFQTWAVGAIQGKHSPKKIADMGIDGFTFLENHPIQVKQMDAVGRPVVDNFVGVLEREKEKRGVIIAFNFTKGALAEVARIKREQGKDIELLTCKQLIREEIPYKKIA